MTAHATTNAPLEKLSLSLVLLLEVAPSASRGGILPRIQAKLSALSAQPIVAPEKKHAEILAAYQTVRPAIVVPRENSKILMANLHNAKSVQEGNTKTSLLRQTARIAQWENIYPMSESTCQSTMRPLIVLLVLRENFQALWPHLVASSAQRGCTMTPGAQRVFLIAKGALLGNIRINQALRLVSNVVREGFREARGCTSQ
jgi:hypothetical protein